MMRNCCKKCVETFNGDVLSLYQECCAYCPYRDIDLDDLECKSEEDS